MIEYFLFLRLRTRRRFLSAVHLLPVLFPLVVIVVGLAGPRRLRMDAEGFVAMTTMVIVLTVVAVSNLTAFLVDEERRRARSRLLRLAGVDGRRVVGAHLLHAAELGAVGVLVGTLAPALFALWGDMPVVQWVAGAAKGAVIVSMAGGLGLWLGYFLPRVVAVIVLQPAAIMAAASLATAALESRLPLPQALAPLVAAHVATLVVLPPLWRLTARRLW